MENLKIAHGQYRIISKGRNLSLHVKFSSPSLLFRALEFNQLTSLHHVYLKTGYMSGNKSDNNLLSVFAYYITKELSKKQWSKKFTYSKHCETDKKKKLHVTSA